jgi:hypothetical protein
MKHTFEYDDETRSISGPGHLVNAVYKLVLDAQTERRTLEDRWWNTYNAALQGAAFIHDHDNLAKVETTAAEIANRRHGKL